MLGQIGAVGCTFTSAQNQMFASDTSRKPASILPSVSFDPRSFTENVFVGKLLLILLHYFIIFG